MADYRNHLIFTIKYLKNEIIPVSMRLRTNVQTSKGLQIIRKAEKQLLNECIRSVNNMLELLMLKRDTCLQKLKGMLYREEDQEILEECNSLIKRVTECRHLRVLGRQKLKFEALLQWKQSGCSNKGQCSSSYMHGNDNMTEVTKKWVKNLSSMPLTEEQERLLAHGPKFSIRPRQPPVEECIAAVEQACSRLSQGEADEMRVEVKKALKKTQCTPRLPSNITREEYKALKELKEDKSRIILTTDKGVALVIMDKAEYNKKAEDVLNTKTYKTILEDPSNRRID